MEGKRLLGWNDRLCEDAAIGPRAALRGKRDDQSRSKECPQFCRRDPVLVARGVGHYGSARKIVSHRNDRKQKERNQARQGDSNNNPLPLGIESRPPPDTAEQNQER